MNVIVDSEEMAVSRIASAIGEPARARMLYSLLDGHARTSTELSIIAGVSPSTASVHLGRLAADGLLDMKHQGKHKYFSLPGSDVARALESLSVLAGRTTSKFEPRTPHRLRKARTCYDHIAGMLGVLLHDQLRNNGWLVPDVSASDAYKLSAGGTTGIRAMGIDLDPWMVLRRRFAFACVDWSERRPHIGGSLGAALLSLFIDKKWVTRELDCRALQVTEVGRREVKRRFGLVL